MNILIVDDENVIREGIKRTIRKAFPEHDVQLAANPDEAVMILRSGHIDVVLTDILMPGMTGLEFMKLSRSSHPHIKWVIISAYSEFAYAKEAVRLGAKDYLLKPIGKDLLVSMIAQLVEEVEREAEMEQEAKMLRSNLKFLREAVFQRWAMGLDIGNMDIAPFVERHPQFQLALIKMESDNTVHLEHYIVENVLTELIERYGEGFVTSLDGKSLLGLITVDEGYGIKILTDELRMHLKKYVKVPFQIQLSDEISDFNSIPAIIQKMGRDSGTLEFDYYAPGGNRAMEVAVQYIRANYNTDVTLEKVASVVFLNPAYFSQVFKQKTGSGFKEYVTGLRMEKAIHLLEHTQLKLVDIAEKIGYQDVKHFTQVFRKRMNVTPTEYRQRVATESSMSQACH
ncbi:response regulator [Paenibacillus dokdonensis]|uniref:Response regulator n=1 Tax=Paenibacillus dokdonensis TaxID=2567944 RepID=A0ABU6GMP8_9BACL|nr:response regulator [Paenibacillus dokdonensis]MEC0239516.1 response regulator [Paenibacillus dokdonensis]